MHDHKCTRYHPKPESYTTAYAKSYAQSYAQSYGYGYANSHTHAQSNTYADGYAQPNTGCHRPADSHAVSDAHRLAGDFLSRGDAEPDHTASGPSSHRR